MHRPPLRPQRSPGAPRPAGRFPSPASCWGFSGPRSPYGGSPRGYPPYSPGSPVYSPASGRGFASQRGRGDGFRRPHPFSPPGAPNPQGRGSDQVQKYFSPAMLQDPWLSLQPVTPEDAAARRTR